MELKTVQDLKKWMEQVEERLGRIEKQLKKHSETIEDFFEINEEYRDEE